MLDRFIKQHHLPAAFKLAAQQYYQPLVDNLFKQYSANNDVYFVGLNGCQGSGKSTLTQFIATALTTQYQLNIVVMSLDDFYLSSEQRQRLATDIHPLLATRGVPGTHDIVKLNQVLIQLKAQQTGFSLPAFNKATDEPCPEHQWLTINKPADIILVEGWCWGVKSQTASQLTVPINKLEQQHDKLGLWRSYVNQQLKCAYEPLYDKIDYWLTLQAPSFDCVYQWRLEQEQHLQASNSNLAHSKMMTPVEILNFIQYFQRLTVQGASHLPHSADVIFYLDNHRHITKMSTNNNH